jgi:hypothetical protein
MIGLVVALCLGGQARAGVYGDDLAKCLVKAASPSDVSAFMVWLYSALSLEPSVKVYSSMTDAQRDDAAKHVAELFQRMMVVDCRKETVAAIKYEGPSALETGFQVFGQVAGRGLFESPVVAANLAKMSSYVDKSKFEGLAKEAGVTASPK